MNRWMLFWIDYFHLLRITRSNELKAYRTLQLLQGSEIPNFLGEYTCRNPQTTDTAFSFPDAILLEFVDLQTLADIRPQDLSMTDRITLKDRAFAVLNKIHDLGVYHRDIRPANVFWNRSKDLKIIDYGLATFKDGKTTDIIEEWTKLDKGHFISMLVTTVLSTRGLLQLHGSIKRDGRKM